MISGTCAGSVQGAVHWQAAVHPTGQLPRLAPSQVSPGSIVPLPQSDGVGVVVGFAGPGVGVAPGLALQAAG